MQVENEIIRWYHKNKRPLTWRNTKNPYIIWLSEIMLQQTRVDQALGYFKRFINHFPDIHALAAASEESVLIQWQGLGYYSRARNLHFSAKHIVNELDGKFPDNYLSIIKLKGVGEYTAAAIASFAFGEKIPAIDGNVYRVLARIFEIDTDTVSANGKKVFKEIADNLIKDQNPADYNQAMMEFGALLCKPVNPLCMECPIQSACLALKHGSVNNLPVKKKAIKLKNRYLHYIFTVFDGASTLKKRKGKDIWQGLFEFPLIETDKQVNPEELISSEQWTKLIGGKYQLLGITNTIQHRLSHQLLHITFYTLKLGYKIRDKKYMLIPLKKIIGYPVPKPMENFINSDEFTKFI